MNFNIFVFKNERFELSYYIFRRLKVIKWAIKGFWILHKSHDKCDNILSLFDKFLNDMVDFFRFSVQKIRRNLRNSNRQKLRLYGSFVSFI